MVIALAVALAFTACGGDDNVPPGVTVPTHTHSYSTAWSFDATQHWHECSCGDKSDVANHTGDPCSDCSYDSTATLTQGIHLTKARANLRFAHGEHGEIQARCV